MSPTNVTGMNHIRYGIWQCADHIKSDDPSSEEEEVRYIVGGKVTFTDSETRKPSSQFR